MKNYVLRHKKGIAELLVAAAVLYVLASSGCQTIRQGAHGAALDLQSLGRYVEKATEGGGK